MREFIEDIYSTHKDELDMFGFDPDECDDENNNCYVYAWFTCGEHKKYFYIGKGKNTRYKHILKEIEAYEVNQRKYKGQKYKYLKDEFGVDSELIYNDITEKEATILEAYSIMEYMKKREPLLNVILPVINMEDEELMEWRDSYFYEKRIHKFLEYYK